MTSQPAQPGVLQLFAPPKIGEGLSSLAQGIVRTARDAPDVEQCSVRVEYAGTNSIKFYCTQVIALLKA